jgi:hypothetical protein
MTGISLSRPDTDAEGTTKIRVIPRRECTTAHIAFGAYYHRAEQGQLLPVARSRGAFNQLLGKQLRVRRQFGEIARAQMEPSRGPCFG